MIFDLAKKLDIRESFLPFVLTLFPFLQLVKISKIHAASVIFIAAACGLFYKRVITISVPTVFFLLWVLLGLFWVVDYQSWASYYYHLIYGMSFVLLLSSLSDQRLRLFVKGLLIVNTILLLVGTVEIFTHIHLPISSLYHVEYTDPLTIYFINSTPSTIFHNPNDYGFYLAISSWWLINAFKDSRHKIWYYSLLILNLFFVTSRISLVAVLLLLVTDIWTSKEKYIRYGLSVILAVYMFCLIFSTKVSILGDYRQVKIGRSVSAIMYFMAPSVLTSDNEILEELNVDNSSMTRSQQSQLGLELIKENYKWGVGLGQTARGGSVHNVWMEVLSDLGLVGVGLLLWVFWGKVKSLREIVPRIVSIFLFLSGVIACLAPSNAISRVGFWLFIAVFCIRSNIVFSRKI